MTKIQMYLAVLIILTMLPTTLVTASPLLTRDDVTKPKKYDSKVVQYLEKNGHLDDKLDARNVFHSQKRKLQPNTAELNNNPETKQNVLHLYSNDEISNGIKSFQTLLGLKVTGDLDEKTMKMMKTPRCGVSDEGNSFTNPFKLNVHHRRRRYAFSYRRLPNGQMMKMTWKKKSLTWNILIYYKHLGKQVQVDTLGKAFNIWEYSSSIKFIKSSDNNPDIRIQFSSGDHGDDYDFDGKGQVLAHAFAPYGGSLAGDIHFDAAESWNIDHDLFSVALHEIGHSLGLAHSKIPASVMYSNYQKKSSLHWDDRDGITALYGPCESKIDAAIYLFGDVYFLRKDMIWKIDEFDLTNSFDKGYPKKIKDEIPGIPNDVDAALTWSDYFLYFLKGTRSFGYNKFYQNSVFDRPIAHDWPKIPNSPDAALCYTSDEITWFFKGDKCWKMNDYNLTVFYGYPKKISEEWPGVPHDIDAAYYSDINHETYFFKDTEYWVVDNEKYSKPPYKAYPGGKINQNWKGVCSEKY